MYLEKVDKQRWVWELLLGEKWILIFFLYVHVCQGLVVYPTVKTAGKDEIWIHGFPGCWNCLKVSTNVFFFKISLQLVYKVVLFFYPECMENGESSKSETIFTLEDFAFGI